MNTKKPRYKLSPELVDGDHWIVVDTPQQVLELVREWADCAKQIPPEDGFSVSVVHMTDEEIENLPEI